MAGSGNWQRAAAGVVREAAGTIGRDRLRALSRRSPARHLAVAGAWLAAGAIAVALAAQQRAPLLWPFGMALAGLFAFNGTVLLHEVLHGLVFGARRPRVERVLACLYALPCGIAPSQFTRWHLDHHAELGDPEADPKRHHLSPKRTSRLLKLLYWTPALFAIYFRAAARESATYEPALRRRIALERRVTIAAHVGLAAVVVASAGWGLWLRVHALPLLFLFPVWFALNRLGQHYDIDPADPVRWATLMRGSPLLWDLVFLWSNYHLEHHLFPGVPAYRLPALRRALAPFLARHGVPERGYGELLWGWLVRNRTPHSDWQADALVG
ncbi:MAG: fatty acid desaturase family protein [Acidobacteriota bacterium]